MAIKDRNNFPKLKKRLQEIKNRKIQIGIIGNAEMALIAGVNEFGAKIKVTAKMRKFLGFMGLHLNPETKFIIIPERSFLRTSFDDRKNIKAALKFGAGLFELNKNLNKMLDGIGLKMVSIVQKKIKSNIPPGNHPFTIEQKGGKDKTLVNTGRLGQSITHKII